MVGEHIIYNKSQISLGKKKKKRIPNKPSSYSLPPGSNIYWRRTWFS